MLGGCMGDGDGWRAEEGAENEEGGVLSQGRGHTGLGCNACFSRINNIIAYFKFFPNRRFPSCAPD